MLRKSIYKILFFSLLFIGCGEDSTGGRFTGNTLDEVVIEDTEQEPRESSLEPIVR